MSLKIAFVLACGLGTTLCSGSVLAAGPTCPDGPIKLGAISTVTGPADFSEVPKAAKAMYDAVNAAGGIKGCKIDYEIADDKADPQVAAQAARDFIDNKKVVAMTGGASLLECAVNAPTYKRANVRSVHGLGVDPVCFNSPNIAPVNVGPYTLTTAVGLFATNTLKAKNLCAMFIIIGGTQEAYKAGVSRWEELTGQKVKMVDLTVPISGDYTPFVIKARDQGCDAVISNTIEPGVVAWVKTADGRPRTDCLLAARLLLARDPPFRTRSGRAWCRHSLGKAVRLRHQCLRGGHCRRASCRLPRHARRG